MFFPETERLDAINESLSLISLRRGLTFGTDSYFLAAFLRTRRHGVAVEFGSGTGVVSLLAAARDRFRLIHAVEIQPYFAALTERNAALNRLSDRIVPHYADIRALSPSDIGGEADAVFSNPPYMRADSGRDNAAEVMNIARREENGTIDAFCASAARLLKYGGYFTVVYRADRMAELLASLSSAKLTPKRLILCYPTPADKPSLVLVEAKKGAAPGLTVSRPLFLYRDKATGALTDDAQTIYDTFSMEHLF